MAGAGGIDGLHAIDGICDLCGENCDSETQELNALTCTFAPNCPEVCQIKSMFFNSCTNACGLLDIERAIACHHYVFKVYFEPDLAKLLHDTSHRARVFSKVYCACGLLIDSRAAMQLD